MPVPQHRFKVVSVPLVHQSKLNDSQDASVVAQGWRERRLNVHALLSAVLIQARPKRHRCRRRAQLCSCGNGPCGCAVSHAARRWRPSRPDAAPQTIHFSKPKKRKKERNGIQSSPWIWLTQPLIMAKTKNSVEFMFPVVFPVVFSGHIVTNPKPIQNRRAIRICPGTVGFPECYGGPRGRRPTRPVNTLEDVGSVNQAVNSTALHSCGPAQKMPPQSKSRQQQISYIGVAGESGQVLQQMGARQRNVCMWYLAAQHW